ncbi:MAG: HIT domain-containing protein [Verrucomicrobia bacterium]|jgi:ATP adenylyltransferase|nr:MAG: HIT domain-containing protein [Verrucomicrobiota bacterium]MDH4470897.1 HIT domain-containing protein [Verrucomicrobiae bacterium]
MEFPKKNLETLWAPWRVEYFQRDHQSNHDFLLEAAHSSDDAAHLVVTRRKNAFLILNKYPYTTGHLMAVPYRKTAEMSDLSEEEALDLWNLAIHAQRLLKAVVHAHGFNLGLNLGAAGGAGTDDHLHLHIVPRWENDQNFMPLLAGVRIIPNGLEQLYQELLHYQEKGLSIFSS